MRERITRMYVITVSATVIQRRMLYKDPFAANVSEGVPGCQAFEYAHTRHEGQKYENVQNKTRVQALSSSLTLAEPNVI